MKNWNLYRFFFKWATSKETRMEILVYIFVSENNINFQILVCYLFLSLSFLLLPPSVFLHSNNWNLHYLKKKRCVLEGTTET